VTCYLCGRDFGSRSLGIHVPNCLKKWEDEQRKLPKKLRLPLPTAPDNLEKALAGELHGNELKEFNIEATKMWNTAVLVPCQHCKRTFFPEKLPKHQKACTQEKPMSNPNSARGVASKLEDLMNCQTNKVTKRKKVEVADNIITEKESKHCKLPDITDKIHDTPSRIEEDPTIEDFIELIEKSEILQEKELSRHLLLVIEYFIKLQSNQSEKC